MKSIEKWADRVYIENNFDISIAISLTGLLGLVIYLLTNDWVIAAFSTLIAFLLVRLISTGVNENINVRNSETLANKLHCINTKN
jgi:hypothetical protein